MDYVKASQVSGPLLRYLDFFLKALSVTVELSEGQEKEELKSIKGSRGK